MYRKLLILLCFVVGSWFYLGVTNVSANQAEVNVRQNIIVKENSPSEISWQIDLVNISSEEFISELEIAVPYDSYKIDSINVSNYGRLGDKLILNFQNELIAPGATRKLLIDLKINQLYEDYGTFKYLRLLPITSDLSMSSMKTTISYPEEWNSPTFISRNVESNTKSVIYEGNKVLELYWGNRLNVSFDINPNLASSGATLIPIPVNRSNIEVVYSQTEGSSRAYFDDKDNGFVIVDKVIGLEGSLSVYGTDITGKRLECSDLEQIDFEVFEGTIKEKIDQVVSKLKSDYKFTQDSENNLEAFNQMSGDNYQLSYITTCWLNKIDIDSSLYWGWDYIAQEGVYFLVWKDVDTYKKLDVVSFARDEISDAVNVPVSYIPLFQINDDEDRETIDLMNSSDYWNFEISEEVQKTGEVLINTFSNKKDNSIYNVTNVINVDNQTNQILRFKDISINGDNYESYVHMDDYEIGLLPGYFEVIEIPYFQSPIELLRSEQTLKIHIVYQNGSEDISYEIENEVLNKSSSFAVGVAITTAIIGLVIFIYWYFVRIILQMVRSALDRKKNIM